MDSGKSTNIQHKGSLETSSMEAVGNGFKPDRMGFSIQGDGGRKQLDGAGSHQLFRDKSNLNEFRHYPGESQGVLSSYSKQQSSGSSLFEEWRRNLDGLNNVGKADLGLVGEVGCESGGIQMDSGKVQQSSGLSKLDHGSKQLEGVFGDVSVSRCSMGTPYS